MRMGNRISYHRLKETREVNTTIIVQISMMSKSISVPRSRADAPVSKRLRSYNINKELGSSFCAICSLIDNTKNLCAAGTFHATKGKVNISHNDKLAVFFFMKMAATVGNEFFFY